MSENILVIPTKRVKKIYKRFLRQERRSPLKAMSFMNNLRNVPLLDLDAQFLPRDQVEEDLSFQQVIAYSFVLQKGGNFLSYSRNGSESRLKNLRTFGFGGHTSTKDGTLDLTLGEILISALFREIREELGVKDVFMYGVPGLMFKVSDSPVDSVHLGFPYISVVKDYQISASDEIKDLKSHSPIDFYQMILESWSKFFVERYFSSLITAHYNYLEKI